MQLIEFSRSLFISENIFNIFKFAKNVLNKYKIIKLNYTLSGGVLLIINL